MLLKAFKNNKHFHLQNIPTFLFTDCPRVGPIPGHRHASRIELGSADADLRKRAQRLARSHKSGSDKLTRFIESILIVFY